MSFVEVTVPKMSRPSAASVNKFSDEELDAVVEMLEEGKSVSDSVVYADVIGKRQPRDVAYYVGFALRSAVLEHSDKFTAKELRVRTWVAGEDEEGYSWALQLK